VNPRKLATILSPGNLETELAAGRIYLMDYREAEDKVEPDFVLEAPLCLLHYGTADKHLKPIAIQVKQRVGSTGEVFYPHVATNHPEDDWAWRYAKSVVQAVEWNYHELGVHLTRSHIVVEVLCISAHRKFSTGHLVYELLKPHFFATLALNRLARKKLIPSMEEIGMLSMAGMKRFINKMYGSFDIIAALPLNELKARKIIGANVVTVDEAIKEIESSLPYYFYALYGLEIWRDMRHLIQAILTTKYTSESSVTQDAELNIWADEVRAHMPSFPRFQGVEQLVDVITYIIYDATVLHSAVNYLQWYYMAYAPNMPSQMARPFESALQEDFSERFLATKLLDKDAELADRQLLSTISKPTTHPLKFELVGHEVAIRTFRGKMSVLKDRIGKKKIMR
jgi:hypothetical protein